MVENVPVGEWEVHIDTPAGYLADAETKTANVAAQSVSEVDFYLTAQEVDTEPPVLNLPSNITAEATGPTGAMVEYTVLATDAEDGDITPTCELASGSTFALGATTVTCTATDAAGNTASASFTVTVVDTTPPIVTVPDDITVSTSDPAGANVSYSGASADDLVDGSLTPVCTPASGSLFAPGTTEVTCSVTDSSGNTGSAVFTVTVNLEGQSCDFTGQPVIGVVPYTGTDAGKKGTGLRLTSMGRIYDSQGASLYTVWRVRNGSDEDKDVKLDAYKTSWFLEFTTLAHTETFIASTIVGGPATHRLFYNGQQVDVKASSIASYEPACQ